MWPKFVKFKILAARIQNIEHSFHVLEAIRKPLKIPKIRSILTKIFLILRQLNLKCLKRGGYFLVLNFFRLFDILLVYGLFLNFFSQLYLFFKFNIWLCSPQPSKII